MMNQRFGMTRTVRIIAVTGTDKTAADANGMVIGTGTSVRPQTKRAVVADTTSAEDSLKRLREKTMFQSEDSFSQMKLLQALKWRAPRWLPLKVLPLQQASVRNDLGGTTFL